MSILLHDKTLDLSEEQKEDVSNYLKRDYLNKDGIKELYRQVYFARSTDFDHRDLGIPTYGEESYVDDNAYSLLLGEEQLLEKLDPLAIKQGYLNENKYVKVDQLYNSMLKTPGERRVVSSEVLTTTIKRGVKEGAFGLGVLTDESVANCKYFKQEINLPLEEMDIIISDKLCSNTTQGINITLTGTIQGEKDEGSTGIPDIPSVTSNENTFTFLGIRFNIPNAKVAQTMGILSYLQSKFKTLEIQLKARQGNITEDEIKNHIIEALEMLGIKPEISTSE